MAAACPQTFFQIYWIGTRDEILARVERAKAAGAVGLIATLDWSFSNGRDWGSPTIPEKVDLRAMLRFAPEALSHPRWFLSFARQGSAPTSPTPNMVPRGERGPTFFGAYGQWMQTPPPSWADVAWLRSQWDGPFMLKGVTRVDDAKRAVDAGVERALGLESRREQPRRDTGDHPRPALRRRGRGGPGRGAARRRSPTRERRREGASPSARRR